MQYAGDIISLFISSFGPQYRIEDWTVVQFSTRFIFAIIAKKYTSFWENKPDLSIPGKSKIKKVKAWNFYDTNSPLNS